MSVSVKILPFLVVVFVGSAAFAQPFFVAPGGDDANPGTEGQPYATVEQAMAAAVPGDTIYVRGGTYNLPNALRIDQSGAEGQYLHLWAYPGETPVLDFTGAPRGLDLRGSYLHVKGLVVQDAADNGVYVKRASYNVIEGVVSRYNGDSGVQVEDGSAHNLLLNVDSYGNYDPGSHGENADGFAIKFAVGPGNVLRGCRAFDNADDGFDFWEAGEGITVEDSWAFHNGYNLWNDSDFQGDSNGFKLGHGAGAHVLIRNLAWDHRKHGFDVNGNTSGVTLYHNTAYANEDRNFYFDDDPNEDETGLYVLRNNVSLGGRVRMDAGVVDDASNTWNAGFNAGGDDFLSLDDTGRDGARRADGSLPVLDFLRLAPGSDLIDAGVDVGLSYIGAAPDLGAFEAAPSTGTAVAEADELPSEIRLFPNYPNPFNPTTHLAFEVARTTHVRLAIYDVWGRRVTTLLDEAVPAGLHRVVWPVDEAGLSSGLYVARLETSGAQASRRMVLVK